MPTPSESYEWLEPPERVFLDDDTYIPKVKVRGQYEPSSPSVSIFDQNQTDRTSTDASGSASASGAFITGPTITMNDTYDYFMMYMKATVNGQVKGWKQKLIIKSKEK